MSKVFFKMYYVDLGLDLDLIVQLDGSMVRGR